MLPKCIWINLSSVLFAKDVVGQGRTMKALLGSIEKHKPSIIKVARWGGCTSSFPSFQKSPRGKLVWDAVFRECCLFQTSDLLLWGVTVWPHYTHSPLNCRPEREEREEHMLCCGWAPLDCALSCSQEQLAGPRGQGPFPSFIESHWAGSAVADTWVGGLWWCPMCSWGEKTYFKYYIF